MPIAPHEHAAHAIRIKSPDLARAAVSALYRIRPDLERRYGEAGRRHCVKDIGHHLRFLAAAVELADAKVFADYGTWAARVMVTHNVAPEDALASFRCLQDVVPDAVPPGASALVRHVISAALASLDVCPAVRGIPPRPRPRAARSPFPSAVASAPSRS
jgi:hypothetical protein